MVMTMTPRTPPASRRVSTFSDSNLSTLESLVLEVALEDAKQQQATTAEGSKRASSEPIIRQCEMDPEDYERIQRLLGNHCCADCESKDTEWASVTYGLLLCAQCSGVHRALGTHISRVRSIKMDHWTEEQLELMRHGGNFAFQRFLEKHKTTDAKFDFYEASIEQKYTSEAAVAYKSVLKQRVASAAKGAKPLDETESSTDTAASSTAAAEKESKQNKFKKQSTTNSNGNNNMDDSGYSFSDDTSETGVNNSNNSRKSSSGLSKDDSEKAAIQEEAEEEDEDVDSDDDAGYLPKHKAGASKSMSLDAWFSKKPKRMASMPIDSASCSGKSAATTSTFQSAIASFARRTVRRSHSASTPTITYMGRSFCADGSDETAAQKVQEKKAERMRRQSDVKLLADMAYSQEEIARENLGTEWKEQAWRQSAPATMQWSADRRVEPFSLYDSTDQGYTPSRRGKKPARHESLRKKLAYTDADLLQIAMDDKEFARLKAGLKTKGAVTNGILEQKLYAFVAKSKLRKMGAVEDANNGSEGDNQPGGSNRPRSSGRQRLQASKSDNLNMMRRSSTVPGPS